MYKCFQVYVILTQVIPGNWKENSCFWYCRAILLWHLSPASTISSFSKVALMGLIINTNTFLRNCLFFNGDRLEIIRQPPLRFTQIGLDLCTTLWKITSFLGFWRLCPGLLGVCPWTALAVISSQCSGRCLKSAAALLMELLSAASHRHNFVMRLHWGLWCCFWVS